MSVKSYANLIVLQDGPYFGNGFRNGWVDQNSIVIWTRLTKNPEMNFNGKKLKVPTNDEYKELANSTNEEEIYSAQIHAYA